MNPQELKHKCAACPQTDYWQCHNCQIWKTLNTPCEFCGTIPAPYKLTRSTSKGLRTANVCEKCLNKLT